MRISSAILMIIAISGIILMAAISLKELDTQYPDANITTSEWDSKYDYSPQINSSVAGLKDKFDKITDTDTGWFTKLTSGIYAIPYAIIAVPGVILTSLAYGTSIAVDGLTGLNIDSRIIMLVMIGMLIWGIFKLVEMFNRTPI